MTVKELMERTGMSETGRTIAYIKDALEELNIISETNVNLQRLNIDENKRFYDMPNDAVKFMDIRVKNHLNSKDEYRSVPRMIHKPVVKDADNT